MPKVAVLDDDAPPSGGGQLVRIDTSFRREVIELVSEGEEISRISASLTERTLKFASSFKALADKARSLDRTVDGDHYAFMREQLSKLINTDDKAVRSRWVAIGAQAPKLLPMAESLPASRDTLYQLALAVEAKQPIQKWVEQGKVTSETTFREAQRLRKPPAVKSDQKPPPIPKSVRQPLPAQVTLSFETFTDAAAVLADLMLTAKTDFRVSANKAFEHALQEALSDETAYQEAKKRLAV